jgi:hypothetical protein
MVGQQIMQTTNPFLIKPKLYVINLFNFLYIRIHLIAERNLEK